MVVKCTVISIKPYGLLVQIEEVCQRIDGSVPHATANFNRIHELGLRVCMSDTQEQSASGQQRNCSVILRHCVTYPN